MDIKSFYDDSRPLGSIDIDLAAFKDQEEQNVSLTLEEQFGNNTEDQEITLNCTIQFIHS